MIIIKWKDKDKEPQNITEDKWLEFLNEYDIHYTTGIDPVMAQKWHDVFQALGIEDVDWTYNGEEMRTEIF